ncbi:hypothetical protein BVC93_24145 [Mycobacterium sp. MS1601]|uniref:hypothetical protein n=1 Tax=Mycobacterium sp. MS1601 TaxID=1936029 RepID=UPI0009791714|nr:hypothetical protein [Mycobacterium sp. MS1601]AQA06668.1 hypothetical protein BVC93_24145 [Mycobacterium sp. MS1601]
MRKQFRTLMISTGALIALGSLPACSGGTSTEATSSTTAATTATSAAAAPAENFPQTARYIADMPMADGGTMTLGVAVSGDKVVAYACDGSKDEAWFFGSQDDGALDITSRFRDTLVADYEGGNVVGDLTMDGVSYTFSAPQVADPAGMYTAELGGVRASWVVRPGDTMTGVQFTPRDDDKTVFELQGEQFRERVRNTRELTPAPQLSLDGLRTTINGQPVVAELVTGDTSFTKD